MSQQRVDIPLKDATYEQLKDFAQNVLGIQFKHNISRSDLLAKINAAGYQAETAEAEKTIPVMIGAPDAVKPKAANGGERRISDMSPDEREEVMVTITIPRTNEPGGNEMVPVAVNGNAMAIPRGKPVPIKWKYFVALCNAVQHIHDPIGDNGEMDPNPRKVMAYNFSLIDGPAEAFEMYGKAA